MLRELALDPMESRTVSPGIIYRIPLNGAALLFHAHTFYFHRNKDVQDTVVRMVTAETFAEKFETLMKELAVEIEPLHLAVSTQMSSDVSKLLELSREPLQRNEDLKKAIEEELEEVRDEMSKQHGALMNKLSEVSPKLDKIYQEQRKAFEELRQGQQKAAAAVSKLSAKTDKIIALLNSASDEDVKGLLEKEFARHELSLNDVEYNSEDEDRFLGQGGFGSVYEGKFQFQDVAVKVSNRISKKEVPKERWTKMKFLFKREIVLCKELQHAHLMRTHGGIIREHPKRQLIAVMELYKAGTVRSFLNQVLKGKTETDVPLSLSIVGCVKNYWCNGDSLRHNTNSTPSDLLLSYHKQSRPKEMPPVA